MLKLFLKSSNTKNIYLKFIGFLTKSGKQESAKKILEEALKLVSTQTKMSKKRILLSLFLKLNSFVEVRQVRIKRRTHTVPFSITIDRRQYLVVKWIMLATLQNKKQVSFSTKLSQEILATIKNTSASKALKYKTQNNFQAFSNRSNIHFRW